MDNFIEDIRADFECKICLQYMHPPIMLCSVGHSFCNNCFHRLDKCPMCRAPLSKLQNLALESIHNKILFPCINASKGCQEMLLGDAILNHEERCRFSWIPCVMKRSEGCDWTGPEVDFAEHC